MIVYGIWWQKRWWERRGHASATHSRSITQYISALLETSLSVIDFVVTISVSLTSPDLSVLCKHKGHFLIMPLFEWVSLLKDNGCFWLPHSYVTLSQRFYVPSAGVQSSEWEGTIWGKHTWRWEAPVMTCSCCTLTSSALKMHCTLITRDVTVNQTELGTLQQQLNSVISSRAWIRSIWLV